MSDSHVLQASQLQFAYRPGRFVLDGVSFRAAAGKLVGILGPNGSGKTTLLRCCLGWLAPAGGSVLLDGRPLGEYSQKGLARMMAYVPQFPRSAFAFPAGELVLMGRFAYGGALGLAGEHDLSVTRLAMEMTETTAFARRTLGELSGGEAQRVMIARALAQQPQVCLLDEPTSHLDIRNQLMIYRMMQRLAHEWGIAVVCVSHDVNLAGRFADRLVLLRDGQVVADGTPEEVIREDVLQQTYGVEVELIRTPGQSAPIVRAK